MAEQKKISLKNIENFIKYIGPKIDAHRDELVVDFEKSKDGLICINYEGKYVKEKKTFLISENTFKMIIGDKEKDFSPEWQEYLADSYNTDMHLYYQYEGSRFG